MSPLGAPALGSLTIVAKRRIEPLHTLMKVLPDLGNGRSLTLARQYSPSADRAIYEWIFLRANIATEVFRRTHPGVAVLFSIDPDRQPPFHVPDFPLDSLKDFTLPELTKLATYSPPSLQEGEALFKEQTTVVFPSQGLPVPLVTAIIMVQIANLLTTIYFWLYFREARASPSFPAAATLFGALARTRFTRCLFVLFLAVPPAASAALASRMLWLIRANGLLAVVVSGLLATLTFVVVVAIRRQPLPARVQNDVAGMEDAD